MSKTFLMMAWTAVAIGGLLFSPVVCAEADEASDFNLPAVLQFENHLLVDQKGMTVYVFDPDTSAVSTCYQGCARAWPPVHAPAAPVPLPQDVTVSPRTDGTRQLVFRGHPVYYYVGDSRAGDKTGDGIGGVWHVITD